jgi:hypothetical protein
MINDEEPLSYEAWLDLHWDELQISDAESGADRELDYNPDRIREKKYQKYLEAFYD